MSSDSNFQDWVRSNYTPERTGEKFGLPYLNFNYVSIPNIKKFPPSSGLGFVEFKFDKKEIIIDKEIEYKEIVEYAIKILNTFYDDDGKEKSKLIMRIIIDKDQWNFVWKRSGYWLLINYYNYDYKPRWSESFPKANFSIKNVESNCKETTRNFLLEYIVMKQGYTEEMITENYRHFVIKSLSPIKRFLDSEKAAIKDERFIPKCKYEIENSFLDEEDFVKIKLKDPMREFTSSGVHVRPYTKTKEKYNRAISEDFIDDEDILLLPDKDIKDWPRQGTLEIVPNLAISRRKYNAINNLESVDKIHLQRLLDLLTRPQALPEVEPISVINIKEVFQRNNRESNAQCKAIDIAFGSSDISLIQGPPGTGKTEVICEIVLQVLRKGGRVLLASPTHVAVDNVLERIYKNKVVRPIRIGRFERVTEEIKKFMLSEQEKEWKKKIEENEEELKKFRKDPILQMQTDFFSRLKKKKRREIRAMIVDQANFVCGTCLGVVNMEFTEVSLNKPFDLMIVDEASKATLIEFLVPAVRAKRWILVGDHRQLAPYVSELELKIYLQRFLESSKFIRPEEFKQKLNNMKSEKDEGFRERMGENIKFHPKVEEIMRYIRRYHEEFHNLEENYSESYLKNIIKVFKSKKKESKNFIEMVEYSLGSSFHFFWKRVDKSRQAFLPYQHRMPVEIAKFLTEEIYRENFLTATNAKLHGYNVDLDKITLLQKKVSPTYFISTEKQNDNFEQLKKRKKGKYFNPLEVKITTKLVEIICEQFPLRSINNKLPKEEYDKENTPFRIGIITFYAEQAREIRSKLQNCSFLEKIGRWRFKHNNKPIQVRVSIVDRFQGQEQEIIILNTVRSNKEQRAGFLVNIQRMNVALSRARHNLFIIGNRRFFIKLKESKYNRLLINLAEYYSNNEWVVYYNDPNVEKLKRINKKEVIIPKRYIPLLEVFTKEIANGSESLKLNFVGNELYKKNNDWKQELGFKSLTEYIKSAEKENLIIKNSEGMYLINKDINIKDLIFKGGK